MVIYAACDVSLASRGRLKIVVWYGRIWSVGPHWSLNCHVSLVLIRGWVAGMHNIHLLLFFNSPTIESTSTQYNLIYTNIFIVLYSCLFLLGIYPEIVYAGTIRLGNSVTVKKKFSACLDYREAQVIPSTSRITSNVTSVLPSGPS